MVERNVKLEKIKFNHGITLISLVITIIVLLILAGVTINMLTGDNGILKKATEAKEETEVASIIEEIQIAYASIEADYWTQNSETDKIEYIMNNFGKYLSEEDGYSWVNVDSNKVLVTKSYYMYTIDEDGKVSKLNPTKIRTQEDLESIEEEGIYQLANDISLDENYTPVKTFNGIFDGGNYTIYSMTSNYTYGMIEKLNKNGIVQNLNLNGNRLGIIGDNYGTVLKCTAEVNISDEDDLSGTGIIIWGYNCGLIKRCVSKGSLIGDDECCGIAHLNEKGGIIEECYNMANLESSMSGGMCYTNYGIIRNCFNLGKIIANAPGAITSSDSYGIIEKCYNIGILENKLEYNTESDIYMVGNPYEGTFSNLYTTNGFILRDDENNYKDSKVITLEEAVKEETYKGFDFDNIWQIEEGKTTPYLRGMAKPDAVNIN